jgi:hypothetical protein
LSWVPRLAAGYALRRGPTPCGWVHALRPGPTPCNGSHALRLESTPFSGSLLAARSRLARWVPPGGSHTLPSTCGWVPASLVVPRLAAGSTPCTVPCHLAAGSAAASRSCDRGHTRVDCCNRLRLAGWVPANGWVPTLRLVPAPCGWVPRLAGGSTLLRQRSLPCGRSHTLRLGLTPCGRVTTPLRVPRLVAGSLRLGRRPLQMGPQSCGSVPFFAAMVPAY